MSYILFHDDCLEKMAKLDESSIDSIVTDPPYGLSFMGKDWDHGVPGKAFWTEALRVAKPGTHLLAFGGTRTFHRLVCAIEDAGWEIRDCVMWVYGSGFPKSHNVANAIDKANGASNRGHAISSGSKFHPTTGEARANGEQLAKYEARTDAGRGWEGWGTALKPAWEPIIVARKPLIGTVAENVLAHGTGGINVDGCRVGTEGGTAKGNPPKGDSNGIYGNGINGACDIVAINAGRWPANLVHDGSNEVVGLFPSVKAGVAVGRNASVGSVYGGGKGLVSGPKGSDCIGYHDSGSAARFFYCAKASKADRDEECEGLEAKTLQAYGDFAGTPEHGAKQNVKARNHHPTVKPTSLMRYLCRLITPPGGVVLDPFCGSGSTGKGAVLEGFQFIGIEREAEYVEIARKRVGHCVTQTQSQEKLFSTIG